MRPIEKDFVPDVCGELAASQLRPLITAQRVKRNYFLHLPNKLSNRSSMLEVLHFVQDLPVAKFDASIRKALTGVRIMSWDWR